MTASIVYKFLREYMSSFSLFDEKYGHCGLTEILPPTGLSTFAIYHFYHQRHTTWTALFRFTALCLAVSTYVCRALCMCVFGHALMSPLISAVPYVCACSCIHSYLPRLSVCMCARMSPLISAVPCICVAFVCVRSYLHSYLPCLFVCVRARSLMTLLCLCVCARFLMTLLCVCVCARFLMTLLCLCVCARFLMTLLCLCVCALSHDSAMRVCVCALSHDSAVRVCVCALSHDSAVRVCAQIRRPRRAGRIAGSLFSSHAHHRLKKHKLRNIAIIPSF